MNKIIICDVDDTIGQLSQDATILCNSLSGKNIHHNEWYTYDVKAIFGITDEQYFAAAVKSKLLENIQPVFGAQTILHGLHHNGYAIHYVTARAWHPDAYNVTLEWLRYQRFPIYNNGYQDCVHIVSLGANKAQFVKEHINQDNVSIAIDDSPQQIKNYIDSKLCSWVFMPDQPWNHAHNDLNLHRITHLSNLTNPYKFY